MFDNLISDWSLFTMDLNQAKEAFELLLHSVRPGATRQFIAWLEDRIEGTPQKYVCGSVRAVGF